MADAWTPSPEQLGAVVGMITAASSTDNATLQQAFAFFEEHRRNPEFIRYLVYTFVHGTHLPPNQREVAAATTKTVIDQSYRRLPADVQRAIKAEIYSTLADESESLRRSAANVVASIARDEEDFRQWPELPAALAAGLASTNPHAMDGSLRCVHMLSDDMPQAFDPDDAGAVASADAGPMGAIVPPLIALMAHADANVRRLATETMAHLQHTPSAAMAAHQEEYLKALGALFADPTPKVRAAVLMSLGVLMETSAEGLWPHVASVMEFVVSCMGSDDPAAAAASGVPEPPQAVISAACSFWASFAEAVLPFTGRGRGDITDVIAPFFAPVVARLMALMVLQEDDLVPGAPTEDVDDSGVADKESDVGHAGAAGTGTAGPVRGEAIGRGRSGAAGGGAAAGDEGAVDADGAGGGGDDEEEDGGDIADGEEVEHDTGADPFASGGLETVRRVAGGALEWLACAYPAEILPLALAEVAKRMAAVGDGEEQWRARESGLLVLGALAMGAVEHLADQLPTVMPHIVAATADSRPYVRATAVWTLSKYSQWIVECDNMGAAMADDDTADPATRENAAAMRFLGPYVTALVARVGDHNKLVQTKTMDACVDIANTAVEAIEPYVPVLMEAYVGALGRYQLKNRLLLYDCISALSENAEEAVVRSGHLPMLLGAFTQRALELPDATFELTALLACLSAQIGAAKLLAAEHMGKLFIRAAGLLATEVVVEAAAADSGSKGGGASDSRIATCCDLIDTIVEAAGAVSADPVAETKLLDTLPFVLRMRNDAVRQSSFALLGTLAQTIPEAVAPCALPLLDVCIDRMAMRPYRCERDDAATSNVLWAAARLLSIVGTAAAGKQKKLLVGAVEAAKATDASSQLQANTAELLGVLGTVFPDTVSAHLNAFINSWCACLSHVYGAATCYTAYSGLLDAILVNPEKARKGALSLMLAFVAYDHTPPDVLAKMAAVAGALRTILTPAEWDAAIGELDDAQRAQLAAKFA